jgi:hypothetical protein
MILRTEPLVFRPVGFQKAQAFATLHGAVKSKGVPLPWKAHARSGRNPLSKWDKKTDEQKSRIPLRDA